MTFNPTDTPNIYPHKSIRVARSESLFTGYYGTNNGVKTIYIPTDTTIDSIINRLHAVHENGYDFHIVQVVKNSENANALNNAEIHYYLSNSNPTKEQYIYASARSFRDKNLSTNQDWLDAIQEAVSDVTTTESTNNDFVYNRIITVPDQNGSNYFSLLQNFADSLSTNNYIILMEMRIR